MRTTVAISDPLLENAKQYAEQRGTTVSNVIEDALRLLLSQPSAAQGPPFKLHTVKGRLVDPKRNLDRISAVIAQDDENEYRRDQ
ncbi:MAG: hypothetical protein NTW74_08870 [Acidobacteria bacterium]|nr:hypothetical protein [Acidobacteriota bacterium]